MEKGEGGGGEFSRSFCSIFFICHWIRIAFCHRLSCIYVFLFLVQDIGSS